MNNDNYVIDEKRNMAWGNPSDALAWYQAELARVEGLLSAAWDEGYCFRHNSDGQIDDTGARGYFVRRVLLDRH